jgi:hypothetical protein
MGERREIVERYWSVCWWYLVPYPCRKTRVVTKWCYDFAFIVVSNRGIFTDYWGCEFSTRYEWRDWHWIPVGFDDSTLYFVTSCFDNALEDQGPCSPALAEAYLESVLTPKFRRFLDRGEPSRAKRTNDESAP